MTLRKSSRKSSLSTSSSASSIDEYHGSLSSGLGRSQLMSLGDKASREAGRRVPSPANGASTPSKGDKVSCTRPSKGTGGSVFSAVFSTFSPKVRKSGLQKEDESIEDLKAQARKSATIEKKSPARGKKSPASDKKSPAIDKKSPAIDKKSPAIDKKSPAIDKKSKTKDKKSTASDNKSAATENGLFGGIKAMGCGLGSSPARAGLQGQPISRRRYLVAPVSRTPSQELVPKLEETSYPVKDCRQQQQVEKIIAKTELSSSPATDFQSYGDQQEWQQYSDIESELTVEEDWPWAEKYQPMSLSDFINQTKTANCLMNLISHGNCPNMLFSGPPGSGKRSLISAMLRDLFGPEVSMVELLNKPFPVQSGRPSNFLVPVLTSPVHMEIDVCSLGDYAVDVLPAIMREMSISCCPPFEDFVDEEAGPYHKVLVIHQADLLSSEAQMTLRRCMTRFEDTCRVILSSCCSPKDQMLEALYSRCHHIAMGAPSIDEILRVLLFIAERELLDLPFNLATRIAMNSKQNLKQAIISLEACKIQKYPFLDDQSIQLGYWEKDVVQIAMEIIWEPTPKQLFIVRPKLQALLMNSVPPGLILQKLQEELVQKLPDQYLSYEISAWAQHFDAKMTSGPASIYQLECFVAKFMSIYNKYLIEMKQLQMESLRISTRSSRFV